MRLHFLFLHWRGGGCDGGKNKTKTFQSLGLLKFPGLRDSQKGLYGPELTE